MTRHWRHRRPLVIEYALGLVLFGLGCAVMAWAALG